MFRVDKDEIIQELSLSPNGSAGWLTNKDEVCPFCGKGGKNGGFILMNLVQMQYFLF